MSVVALLLAGCLVNTELYEERRAALTDDDGDGLSDEQGDCDDQDPAVGPGRDELCNDQDDDCDGEVDEDPVDAAWYPDGDGDGFGAQALLVATCQPPDGYVEQAGDCDDADGSAFPGADETCDGVDQDCDGLADEEPVVDAPTWYLDADGDGWGDDTRAVQACDPGADYAAQGGDCDDLDDTVSPGADELCGNGRDDDCDADEGECRWEGELTVDDAAAVFYGELGGDHLGAAMVSLGDLDGDGVAEVAIGAYGVDGPEVDSGRVYVWPADVSGDVDERDAMAVIDGTGAYSFAGWTLARVDDFDKDGTADLLVGANNHDGAGAVFIFDGPVSGDLTTDDALVTIIVDQAGADLGSAVADGGDPDGDGYGAIVVGASMAGADGAGRAWLVEGGISGARSVDEADTVFVGEVEGDGAGFAAVSGDLDGDGLTDVAVGAPFAGADVPGAGLVYILLDPGTGSASLADADAVIEGEGAGDMLGARLVSRGDLDGDGIDDLVGSAPFNDASLDDAGAVFIVGVPTGGLVSMGALTSIIRGGWADQVLGASLDFGMDHNGDGVPDMVVGTGSLDGSPGRLDVFYGPFSGATESTSGASVVSDESGDGTGFAVAMTEVTPGGDVRLLVGAPDRNDGAGMAWITTTARP